MSLAGGTRLGGYEILAPLGAGGMGEVYRARDTRLGRDVALKVLPAATTNDPHSLARFAREARIVAALNHPHIVTIFSTEEAEGVRFMTMELVEGRSLEQVIPAGGLSMARFFDVATALADALSAAHQKQITHRDLKPANVMVADDGRIKVLDFGLSRGGIVESAAIEPTAEEATLQRLTRDGTILGTMPYMSPEQVEARPLDGRTDIFSLGVVLYEMATGGRPFRGDTSAALISSILRDHPRPVRALRPDAPEGASEIIARCLEKAPRDRYQTAQEVLAELRTERRVWESGTDRGRSRPATPGGPGFAPAADLRVAILPFVARPTGGDAEALAEGLTEDVAAGIGRFPYLRVVSRAAAERLRAPASETPAAPNARYCIDGTIRAAGAALRITVRLVDAGTGTQLWTHSYERSLEAGFFALQDDIAPRVVATIADMHGLLVRAMAATLRERSIEDLALDELVLRYFAYLNSLRSDEHSALRSAFEQALARQPAHALGWAVLANLYQHEYMHGLNVLPRALERSAEAAARSIEIDPSSQYGWQVSAGVQFFRRDLGGFRAASERAIALNPLNSETVAISGMMLAYTGEWAAGTGLVERAMSLNHEHPGWYHYPLFLDCYRRGEFEAALAEAKRANMPQFLWTPFQIAAAAGQLGRVEDARSAVEALRRAHPELLEGDKLRSLAGVWLWDESLVDRMIDGVTKAFSLDEREAPSSGGPTTSTRSAEPGSTRAAANRPQSGPRSGPSTARALATAVAPFSVPPNDPEMGSLADGLSESIATSLARFRYLTVRRGADARFVLEGSVRRSGRALRVAVRLVDSDTGVHLWAENYDRAFSDGAVFELVDDLASRIVTTVAEQSGVLVRAMGAPLLQRPVEDLGLDELVLRYFAYMETIQPTEHARLREAFEQALEREPSHALGWAHLAFLYQQEHSHGMNTRPEPLERCARAAARSTEVDPTCQAGWEAMATARFFERDLTGLRVAADRVIALNPLSASVVWVASLLALAGEWERGTELVRRAMERNPQHAGWYELSIAIDDCRRGAFDEAVAATKRANLPQVVFQPLIAAVAAGHLSRAGDARAAIEDLRRNHPAHCDPAAVRRLWSLWTWDAQVVEVMVEGLRKAEALAG